MAAEPKIIKFKTSDGQEVTGTYYPAAVKPVPIVVYFAFVDEWCEIAPWLQNRGQGGKCPNLKKQPWLDPSWFPKMNLAKPIAVLVVKFPEPPRVAALTSSLQAAGELEGVDPQKIAAMGPSIGADGATNACFDLNLKKGKALCVGALAWAPGNWMGVPYINAVKTLQDEKPPKTAWCFVAEGDPNRQSPPTCRAASGANYRSVIFSGNGHAFAIINPNVTPNALELMLEFLKISFGF